MIYFLSPWGNEALGSLPDLSRCSFTLLCRCLPVQPFLSLPVCPDTFCLCHSSFRVKNSRVGFDYLITMVTRMTFMPICAWQDAANLYFSANQENCYLCFSPYNLVPSLWRSWCCYTMKLSIKHQVFRDHQKGRICIDVFCLPDGEQDFSLN